MLIKILLEHLKFCIKNAPLCEYEKSFQNDPFLRYEKNLYQIASGSALMPRYSKVKNLSTVKMIHQEKERLEEKWLKIGGQSLHALFVPNDSVKKSVPIVLVCGLGISSSYMIPTALELAKGTEIYCPDLPGFGQSSKPAHALNISELSNSLAAFMKVVKIERAVLIGHSFGCQIAAEFALQHPEKLERLVLAAPSGDPNIKSGFRYFGRLMLDAPREPFSLIPMAIRDYLTAGLIRGLRTFQFALQDRFEDKLHQIETPTLVVRGSRDPIVSEDWVRKVSKLLPQGKFINIKGAAHAVNYNSADKFARVVEEFLERGNL